MTFPLKFNATLESSWIGRLIVFVPGPSIQKTADVRKIGLPLNV